MNVREWFVTFDVDPKELDTLFKIQKFGYERSIPISYKGGRHTKHVTLALFTEEQARSAKEFLTA